MSIVPPTASSAQAPTPYYSDDFVTLYHGKCEDILPGLKFDAIVTDPPYGMSYEHGARKGGVRLGHDGKSIEGDQEPFNPAHLLRYAVPTIMWGGNHFADKLPASRGWLIWDKRDSRPANDQSDCELAWTNCLTTARVHSQYWSGNVRTGREQAEGRLHVNQKPIALMHWCLTLLRNDGATICDPYAGSGTTLAAAKERHQFSVGIEYDEEHCETIAKRLAQDVLFGGVA